MTTASVRGYVKFCKPVLQECPFVNFNEKALCRRDTNAVKHRFLLLPLSAQGKSVVQVIFQPPNIE